MKDNKEKNIDDTNLNAEDFIHYQEDNEIGLDIFKYIETKKIGKIYFKDYKLTIFLKKLSKYKALIITLLSVALCLIIGLGVFFGISQTKKNISRISFDYSKQDKEIGQIASKVKYKGDTGYCIYYPTFSYEHLNNEIEKDNRNMIRDFVSTYKQYNAKDIESIALMHSDYDSKDYKNYIQIVRTTKYLIGQSVQKKIVTTFLFDLKNNKILTDDDVFDSTFKEYISARIRRYLKQNSTMTDYQIEKIAGDADVDISTFSFVESDVNFYLKTSDTPFLVSFYVDNIIKNHIKIDYLAFINKNEGSKDDATSATSSL